MRIRTLQNGTLGLILCFGGTLLGCSSKPESAMIEADIKSTLDFIWGKCQIAKVTNVKEVKSEAKENIEKRPVWFVTYAVTVEGLEDVSNWYTVEKSGRCDTNATSMLIRGNGNDINKPFVRGQVVTYETYGIFIKSDDKGWLPAK